jgi:hypothetical protein
MSTFLLTLSKRLIIIGENMRNFDTGATRDTDDGKLDYEAFLSPLVIERYARYMHQHRVQADGKLRDGDNWQKGFGDNHQSVCMKSLWRHFMDLWCHHRVKRDLAIEKDFENVCCAILFNVSAILHQYLKVQNGQG